MGKYKIVFSDLDGTLLGSNGVLSEENANAIKRFKELGIPFVPTTGRALGEIPKKVLENRDIRYYITSNGTAVYDKADGSFRVNGMTREEIDFLLSVVSDMTVLIGLHHGGIAYYHKSGFENYKYFRMNDYYYSELISLITLVDGDMIDFAASLENIQCFCIFFKYDEEHDRACRLIKESGMFNLAASVKHAIEVTRISATKGRAIEDFCEKLGFSISDSIALGDSKNDITLLQSAGRSLAVRGSMPELLPYADEVICSSDEHTAKYVLDNYFTE